MLRELSYAEKHSILQEGNISRLSCWWGGVNTNRTDILQRFVLKNWTDTVQSLIFYFKSCSILRKYVSGQSLLSFLLILINIYN